MNIVNSYEDTITSDSTALAIASSDIDVILLDGEQTSHSALEESLNNHNKLSVMCNIKKKAEWQRFCKKVKLLFGMNVPTVSHKYSPEALHRNIQDFNGSDRLLDGAVL